jgi:heme exporter protein D
MMPDLGNYGVYVLGAYGGTLFLMAALVVLSLRRGRKARAALRRIEEETARNAKN